YGQDAALPEYHCPDGGEFTVYEGQPLCIAGPDYEVRYKVSGNSVTSAPHRSVPLAAADSASQKSRTYTGGNGCPITETYTYKTHSEYGGVTFDFTQVYSTYIEGQGCKIPTTYTSTQGASWVQLPTNYYCPPDAYPALSTPIGSGADTICTKPAEPLPTDDT